MTNIKNILSICFVFIFEAIIFPRVSPAAGKFSNPKSTGMAGAYIGLARGADAPSWNPANLGLSTTNRSSINLLNVGVGLYNNSFDLSQYNKYNGDSLTTEARDDILNSIPDDDFKMMANTGSQLLGFASGHFAFSVEALFSSKLQLDENFFEVMLRGNEMDKVYQFNNTKGEAFAMLSYNVSGALPLKFSKVKSFAIGASIKYLQGLGYMKIKDTQGLMTTTINGLEAHGIVTFESAEGGSGFGFDFGIASEVNHNWSFSLVLKNVYSSIQWAENASEKNYSFLMDPITLDIVEEADSDSIFKTEEKEQSLVTIASSLPAELHLGGAYNSNNLSLTMDYIQGLNNKPGCSTSSQFAYGIQYRVLPWLHFRTGIAIGGEERFKSAAGFGVQFIPFSFDFGVSNCGGLFLRNQRGLNLAVGIGFWF